MKYPDNGPDSRGLAFLLKDIPPAGVPPWEANIHERHCYENDVSTQIFSPGLRPCSPDGLPYVGRTGKFSNLSIATGHAMMGLSLGPITGRLMSEILSGEKPSIPIDLLSPDRYA